MDSLTVNEVAELLHVCRQTVARWIREGKLPASDLAPGEIRAMWRISREDLYRFVEQRKLRA